MHSPIIPPYNHLMRLRRLFLFLSSLILWLWVIVFIFLVDPVTIADIPFPQSYTILILIFWSALFLTLYLIRSRLLPSLAWSGGFAFYLFLRLQGLGHEVNALLLLILLIIFEYINSFTQPKRAAGQTRG